MVTSHPIAELSVFPILVVKVLSVLMIIASIVGVLVERWHEGNTLK